MATVSPLYAATATITLSPASVTNGSYRQSTSIDNTTNKYMDARITGKLKSGASGVSTTGYVNIYYYGYDGTQYSNGASGTDGTYAPDNDGCLMLLRSIPMVAVATSYNLPIISVMAALNLPCLDSKWGLFVLNGSGGTFDTTSGNFVFEFQGVNYTVA